jgi:hypothetical protein
MKCCKDFFLGITTVEATISRFRQITQNGHVPGGGRPLLREGGLISYEARRSECSRVACLS